jgi:hypothetical protein
MSKLRTNIILRIVFDIILFFGVFIMPFWLFAVVALASLVYFKDFYEFIPFFMMRDFLYALPEARFFGSVYILTLSSIVIFLMVNFIKSKVFLSR